VKKLVIIPELKPELQKHKRYLEGYRLDYKNFEVIDIVPQDKEFAVTVMHDRRTDAHKPWCIQYRGSGRYFFTREELDDYCRGRDFKGW
jgi:hypothetical protein